MLGKIYLTSNDLTKDSFRLAKKIYDSGWHPEVIVGLWRGGTPVGIAVQEFLQYKGVKSYHTAVKTMAYTGIGEHGKPVIENLEPLLRHIKPDTKVLVVDDIFDSGDTCAAMKESLSPHTNQLRFATLYYKPLRSKQDFAPDYYQRETNEWLVFPHEIMGLTPEEIACKDPDLAALLEIG